MLRQIFYISGYWKDDKSTFKDYKVVSDHTVLEKDDDGIFFYGMSEAVIKDAIEKKEDTVNDFVITSYRGDNEP